MKAFLLGAQSLETPQTTQSVGFSKPGKQDFSPQEGTESKKAVIWACGRRPDSSGQSRVPVLSQGPCTEVAGDVLSPSSPGGMQKPPVPRPEEGLLISLKERNRQPSRATVQEQRVSLPPVQLEPRKVPV